MMAKQPLTLTDPGILAAEAAVRAARADLTATVDALSGRLDPRIKAQEAAAAARTAVHDAQGLLTGQGFPAEDPRRSRNVKLLAGAVLGAVALVAIVVIRRR